MDPWIQNIGGDMNPWRGGNMNPEEGGDMSQHLLVMHSGWNNLKNVVRWDFFDGFQTNVDEAKTK